RGGGGRRPPQTRWPFPRWSRHLRGRSPRVSSLRAMSLLLARRFRLLEPIGEGGSGAVGRAWARHARCVVAVKILPSYLVPLPLPAEHPHLALPDDLLTDG